MWKGLYIQINFIFQSLITNKYLPAFDFNVFKWEESVLFQSGTGSNENCAITVT